MAATVNVAGLSTIKVGTGAVGALETLGYSRDGVDIAEQAYFLDVPGDENGGDSGPPIDIQYMGEVDLVRITLTKYDKTVMDKLRPRVLGGTLGTPSTPGTLMMAGSGYVRLTIANANDPRNYPIAIPRAPIDQNRGTRFSSVVLEFECHRNLSGGVLHNTTTS